MAKNPSSEKAKNDRALRFYRDVLGLERLHYGIWNEGDDLTFDALGEAQRRYEDFLIDSVPDGCRRILDVGCGTGEMCLNMKRRGYVVEGLSPDRNQKKVFSDKLDAPFHFTRFENFEPEEGAYDCIIMSESAQYIPMDKLFAIARKALKSNGHLIVCDYFVVDQDAGILSKSGHDHREFLNHAALGHFKLISRRDITKEAAKTLDMGKLIASRILLGLDIYTERIREKHRIAFGFLKWVFRKKLANIREQMELLDARRFSEVKRYEFFIFEAQALAASAEEAQVGIETTLGAA